MKTKDIIKIIGYSLFAFIGLFMGYLFIILGYILNL